MAALLPRVPEWRLDSGHAHPDAASFIIWAGGRYITGDTGYAGQPHARHHNTITVADTGQGHDGGHDVWRQMSADALDRIRILSAVSDDTRIQIEADATSAYPTEAGLRRFVRRFTYLAPGTFVLRDEIGLAEPKPVQWFLQSDTPFRAHGDASAETEQLRVLVSKPARAAISTAPTFLTAPGKPGAITTGSRDQRGYHLRIDLSPALRTEVEVRFEIKEVQSSSSKLKKFVVYGSGTQTTSLILSKLRRHKQSSRDEFSTVNCQLPWF